MAKTSGLGDGLLVAGYDLSGDVGSLSKIGGGPALLDVTAINKSAHERIGGLRDGGITFNSFFNPAAAQEHLALSPLPRVDVLVGYLHGTLLGSPAACCWAKQVNYDGTRANDGAYTLAVDAQANGYGLEWGVQLTPGMFTATSALTGTMSTFETTIGTWVALTNCTIAQSAAQAHGGTQSLALTSVAAGTMTAAHITDVPNGTGGIPVVGGGSYLVSGWFRTAVSARVCAMTVDWYTAAGAAISTTTGTTVNDTAVGWTQASSYHTAPATAAFAIVQGQVAATGAGAEVHYLDDVLFVLATGSVDNGASTAFGLQAYLQVSAITGTDATVTVQDSPDNATFTNVTSGSFAQTVAARTFQRIATLNNATINRYLRVQVTTVAGYTSLSYSVIVVRNTLAVVF